MRQATQEQQPTEQKTTETAPEAVAPTTEEQSKEVYWWQLGKSVVPGLQTEAAMKKPTELTVESLRQQGFKSIDHSDTGSFHDPQILAELRKDDSGRWPLTEDGIQKASKEADKLETEAFRMSRKYEEDLDREISGQAQPKKKDESKFLPSAPGGFTRAWILPTGKIAQIGGQWHHQWLSEDPEGQAAADKYKLNIPPFAGNDDPVARESALRAGFVRVNLNRNNGLMTVEGRAADWNKRKPQVESLVQRNLNDIDRLRVSLMNPDLSQVLDSKTADLFNMDSNAEKMAAIPFLNESPRAARTRATETPAFREPGSAPEAPLPPVYGKPEFAAFGSAGNYIGKYGKYQDAQDAAGTGGSVKILKTVQGQAQPKNEPDAVRMAAVRDKESGKIYRGISHSDAYVAMGKNNTEHGFDVSKFDEGFVTNNGEFLNRKQAFQRAVKMGQISGDEWTALPGNLESGVLENSHWVSGQAQPANPRTAIKFFTGDETPEVRGTGFRGRPTLWDAAKFLSEPNAKLGKLGRESESDLNEHATALADEAAFALGRDPSAIGWYDDKLTKMKNTLEEYHPELKTDPNKYMVYKALLAINSNGQNIDMNLQRTDELYRQWKKDGAIDTAGAFGGKNSPAINVGLRNLMDLIKAKGADGAREFLETDFTVGDLKKLGFAIPGELVSAKVKGSVILGPKIGSFYGNLNGDFSSVTMDRWFMRTFNRIGGTLTAPLPSPLPNQIQNVLNAFKGRRSDMGHDMAPIREELNAALSGLKSKTMEPEEMQNTDSPMFKWLYGRFRAYEGSRFADRSVQNVSVKNLYENLFGTENGEKPGTGSDRLWIRRVISETQRQLREKGINLTNADLQALLWYYEKELYAKLYPQTKRGAPTDYAKAAERFVADQRGQQPRPEQPGPGPNVVVEPRALTQ
jgi:hypothetical protein